VIGQGVWILWEGRKLPSPIDKASHRDYDNVWSEPAQLRDNNNLDDAMNLRGITRIYIIIIIIIYSFI